LFGQILVMRLFTDRNILTQVCGNNFVVLKVAPPLVVTEQQLVECITSIRDVVESRHSSTAFSSDALKLGRKSVSAIAIDLTESATWWGSVLCRGGKPRLLGS
jgi:ornithine--oxo-acid transaminase